MRSTPSTKLNGCCGYHEAQGLKALRLAQQHGMHALEQLQLCVHYPYISPAAAYQPLSASLHTLYLFQITDTSAFKKGQELVEDLKDKYETSDHPVVHKVEVGRAGCRPGSWQQSGCAGGL